MIVYKKLLKDRLAELLLLPDSRTNVAQRSKFAGAGRYVKYRTDKARVVKIYNMYQPSIAYRKGRSLHNPTFIYTVGKTVRCTAPFDANESACGSGIHFFFEKEAAFYYENHWAACFFYCLEHAEDSCLPLLTQEDKLKLSTLLKVVYAEEKCVLSAPFFYICKCIELLELSNIVPFAVRFLNMNSTAKRELLWKKICDRQNWEYRKTPPVTSPWV